ncbi:hypothetical protein C8R46DRAFT_1042365 [Mycena filopes]|nr:hypothetical protein C8R46DRAFT_1042365 [Mycena filopes]
MYEFSDYTAPTSDRDFFTGPVPDAQYWDPKFNAWNAKHHAVKRVSRELFVLVGQGQDTGTYVAVSAKQVALFVTHNEGLWFNHESKRGPDPLGYPQFAMHLIAFDSSNDVWAYFDDQAKQQVYPTSGDGAQLDIPTWETWSVHPHQIGEYRVPGGMALVSQESSEAIERQKERHWIQQQKARRKRELERQARSGEPYAKSRNESEVRAAILARTQGAGNGGQAVRGGRRNGAKTRQHLPNHAPPPQAQVQSTSANTPPITTINPAQIASTSLDMPPVPQNFDNMSETDLLKYLESHAAGASTAQSEDTNMDADTPLPPFSPDITTIPTIIQTDTNRDSIRFLGQSYTYASYFVGFTTLKPRVPD